MLGRGKTKAEVEAEDEKKRKKREEKRAVKRAEARTELESKDILDVGKSQFKESVEEIRGTGDDDDNAAAEEEHEGGGGYLRECFSWLVSGPKLPPRQWETYRREEIENYIADRRGAFVGRFFSERFYFRIFRRRSMKYAGDFDILGRKDGRGMCLWPDPPYGGGESYFGLWRQNQPNAHGLFRWYNGDMYFGEWALGKMQGYGVYHYGKAGVYAGDSFMGAYFAGLRQGTGVYQYAGGTPGELTGIYMGDWVKGQMNGYGVLLYADGESYVGHWRLDKKDGLGTYIWGRNAGEFAGDKYEGTFVNGFQEGSGRTIFADGGWHKGQYRKGKPHGWGVMQRADGWEYIGKWKEGELDGEVVNYYAFGFAGQKTVQKYLRGTFESTREFDTAVDWSDIEAVAIEFANAGETSGFDARAEAARVKEIATRAKQSQRLAEDAAEEARYWVKQAVEYAKRLGEWWGYKQYFVAVNA